MKDNSEYLMEIIDQLETLAKNGGIEDAVIAVSFSKKEDTHTIINENVPRQTLAMMICDLQKIYNDL